MSAFFLRWLSVAALIVGAIVLTFPNFGPWADGISGRAHFMIPIAYFLMVAGAVGLSVGWFLKQRKR
ncbi:hypothetical protein OS189_02345 [Sulfitobacter sp. F26169L]|uniref:hypothetical protein n=1 Tax=Sulfitobacter sp. F26169L TaxID=2996015 RepID=UPI002260F14D|nr:hypothetical protein [Sulfitobacter sp. F26169L]MCX7565183.1 hypothetical protein [Sulfitobacter sp. F26169L]